MVPLSNTAALTLTNLIRIKSLSNTAALTLGMYDAKTGTLRIFMWGMVPFVKQGGINFELLASYHIIPYMSLITSYNYLNLLTNTDTRRH